MPSCQCPCKDGNGLCKLPLKTKHYCYRHEQYQGVIDPDEFDDHTRCKKCHKFFTAEKDFYKICQVCLESKDIIYCVWKKKNGKDCENISSVGKKLCGVHKNCVSQVVKQACTDTISAKKCSNCTRFLSLDKFADGTYKTCLECNKRSTDTRSKIKESKNDIPLCQAMISEKNNPGKKHQCPSKAQKDSKYCGVHKGIEKAAVRKDNKEKKCTTHGCKSIMPLSHSNARCVSCRNKSKLNDYKRKYVKYGGAKENYTWEMDNNYTCYLLDQPCFYCDFKLGDGSYGGIDRLDNNISYTKDNCVPSCRQCNFMKGEANLPIFIKRCQHIGSYVYDETKLYPDVFDEKNDNVKEYSDYTYRGKKKKDELTLTKEEFKKMIKESCYYCGSTKNIAIDRVNSNINYTKANCIPCCTICNYMKNEYSQNNFITRCNDISSKSKRILDSYKNLEYHTNYISSPELMEEYTNICNVFSPKKNESNELIKLRNELIKNFIHLPKMKQLYSNYKHNEKYYKDLVFNPKSLEDLLNLDLELHFHNDNDKTKDIWNYFRENVSSFTKDTKGMPGRQLYILVYDRNSKKYLGVISLTSDITDIPKRDKFIGWSESIKINKDNEINRLDNIMNISTCVPLQPFGHNCCGGKLLSMLCFSKEVFERFKKKYNDDLLGLTTMSLNGKSIQYDRLSIFKYLGLTKGVSTSGVNAEITQKCKKYLELSGRDMKKLSKKSSSRHKIIIETVRSLGLCPDEILKSVQKGIYFGYTCPNSKDILCQKKNTIKPDTSQLKSVSDITKEWYERWGENRFMNIGKNRMRTVSFTSDVKYHNACRKRKYRKQKNKENKENKVSKIKQDQKNNNVTISMDNRNKYTPEMKKKVLELAEKYTTNKSIAEKIYSGCDKSQHTLPQITIMVTRVINEKPKEKKYTQKMKDKAIELYDTNKTKKEVADIMYEECDKSIHKYSAFKKWVENVTRTQSK